jgi:dephospho-CoA kinase
VVHDVPLLAETANAASRGYAAVIVVEAPREVRLERLEGRGVARPDAEARMASQASDEERRAIATHVIDNGSDREALAAIVDELWADLLVLRDERANATPDAPDAPSSHDR